MEKQSKEFDDKLVKMKYEEQYRIAEI